MQDFCGRTVAGFEDRWVWMGWVLFGTWVYGPIAGLSAINGATGALPIMVIGSLVVAGLAFLAWWLVDAIDQQVPWWHYPAGAVMFAVSCLPRGSPFIAFPFLAYMFRVRE